MIEFLKQNTHWLFSGAGIAFISWVGNRLYKKNKTSNSITINNNIKSTKADPEETYKDATEKLKVTIRILFIDDQHTKFKMVSILKKAGWKNTKSIKDITDLDDFKAQEADIIFVDINGVGKTLFEDEGLGLASALKKKYPQKKIVLYSAETKGNRFHKALREVDDCLSKDAEPYQFMNLIETLCR